MYLSLETLMSIIRTRKILNATSWKFFKTEPPPPLSFCNSFYICVNFTFRLRRFILLVQISKASSMSYSSNLSSWKLKSYVKLELIYDEGYIHWFQLGPTHKISTSSRSTKFRDILLWSISQLTTKTVQISMRIVVSSPMKRAVFFRIIFFNWDSLLTKQKLATVSHSVTRKRSTKRLKPVGNLFRKNLIIVLKPLRS